MLAKGLRSRQAEARASVLAAVIASTTTRVVAKASSLPRITVGTPMGDEGVTRNMVAAKTLMYQDCGVQPAALWHLVD